MVWRVVVTRPVWMMGVRVWVARMVRMGMTVKMLVVRMWMVGVGRMMVWMMMMWRVRSEVMVGTRLERMRRSEGVMRVWSGTSVVWVMDSDGWDVFQ